jgi:hypothetical protein
MIEADRPANPPIRYNRAIIRNAGVNKILFRRWQVVKYARDRGGEAKHSPARTARDTITSYVIGSTIRSTESIR